MEVYKEITEEMKFINGNLPSRYISLIAKPFYKDSFKESLILLRRKIHGLQGRENDIITEIDQTFIENVDKCNRLISGYNEKLNQGIELVFFTQSDNAEFQMLRTDKEIRMYKGLSFTHYFLMAKNKDDFYGCLRMLCEKYVYVLFKIREAIDLKENSLKGLSSSSANDGVITPQTIAVSHLECLKGCWKGKKIMSDKEYDLLIKYATQTIENNEIPKRISAIKAGNSGLTKAFIQHTFYRLWLELKRDYEHEQKVWVEFLKVVFKDHFSKTSEQVLLKKFKDYANNYDQDRDLITYLKQ